MGGSSHVVTGARESRTKLWRWLRIGVSVGLLALLLAFVDLSQAWAIVRGARLDWLLVALLLFMADRLLAAYRWHILVRGKHAHVGFGALLRLVFVSSFLGYFTPGNVGAEFVRIFTLGRSTSDFALAFSSVLVERVQALLALIALVFLGLALSPSHLPSTIAYSAWAGLALLTIGAAALMHPRARLLTNLLLRGRLLEPVRTRLAKLYIQLDAYRGRPGLMAYGLLVALCFQLTRVLRVLAVAWSLGIDVSLLDLLVVMPIIILVSQLPISVAGIGVREVSFVYLLGLVGVAPAEAFALSLLSFVLTTLSTLPGAWFCARAGTGRPAPAADAPRGAGRE